jgi:hypothetical protein
VLLPRDFKSMDKFKVIAENASVLKNVMLGFTEDTL